MPSPDLRAVLQARVEIESCMDDQIDRNFRRLLFSIEKLSQFCRIKISLHYSHAAGFVSCPLHWTQTLTKIKRCILNLKLEWFLTLVNTNSSCKICEMTHNISHWSHSWTSQVWQTLAQSALSRNHPFTKKRGWWEYVMQRHSCYRSVQKNSKMAEYTRETSQTPRWSWVKIELRKHQHKWAKSRESSRSFEYACQISAYMGWAFGRSYPVIELHQADLIEQSNFNTAANCTGWQAHKFRNTETSSVIGTIEIKTVQLQGSSPKVFGPRNEGSLKFCKSNK